MPFAEAAVGTNVPTVRADRVRYTRGAHTPAVGYGRGMFFKQFYLEGLGHPPYLLGSDETGEALVFDPRRDVETYQGQARKQGLRIRYALDSHGHNDYLSRLNEIAARTGAQVLSSAGADLGYDNRPVRDGEQLDLGDVGIEVLQTPGHTPEHLSRLVHDRSVSTDQPALLLSGGALLVGDLTRPDLLGGWEQAEESARAFCATIQKKILQLPDHVEVFPTHVAGSLCGGSIGSRLSTTVGYERRTNPIPADLDAKDNFVERCLRLDNLPAVPPYWRRMRAQNLAGVRGRAPRRSRLGVSRSAGRAEVARSGTAASSRCPRVRRCDSARRTGQRW
jgi:hydroxyacylglutathione hydrolase